MKKNISAFLRENTAAYISGLTNDIQTIENGYLWNTFTVVDSLLTFFGAIVLMLWYSPLLTAAAMLLSLLPLLASLLTGSKVAKREKKVSDQNEAYCPTARLPGRLFRHQIVSGGSTDACHFFGAHQVACCGTMRKTQNADSRPDVVVAGATAQLGVFLFLGLAGSVGNRRHGRPTPIFVQLMNYVLSPIGTIPTCLAERKAARALVEKMAEALRSHVREEEETESAHLEIRQGIAVKGLTFGAASRKLALLKNVSCFFARGGKYAIVGASGCGKSTLLHLLMASDPAYGGEICFDETELRQIGSKALYETESIIQQNVFVFNATIRDNITMFREFPETEINTAIRLSGLSALIAEKGADFLCGENGSGLSGGEKQRISIARSLLKKSQVLLVDEATASLDAETAYQVSGAILGFVALRPSSLPIRLRKDCSANMTVSSP